jgi:Spy/CpxP family protein refolding chaperone
MTRHLVTAFALALSLGTAGVASAQTAARPDRDGRAQHDSTGRRGRGGPGGFLLRGITLTADQQARVTQLRDAQRKQFEANRPARDGAAGARPERQRGDTTGMGARRVQMEQRRAQEIQSLRGILTAEQRVQFDRNVAEAKTHAGERRGGRGAGDHKKGERKAEQK